MKIKSIWSSIAGGVTSAFPILFACCKGGACVGVCVTPVASLFGISAATIAASPLTSILEPVFIALSAVSFTVSYYSLYVIPKLNCSTGNACDCAPGVNEKRKNSVAKLVFWFGLLLSIGFISYFEYSKYNASETTGCSPSGCASTEQLNSGCGETTGCSGGGESACCEKEDTLSTGTD